MVIKMTNFTSVKVAIHSKAFPNGNIYFHTSVQNIHRNKKCDYLDTRPEDDGSKCCSLASPQKDREGKKHE
jgi:hypothetical protein